MKARTLGTHVLLGLAFAGAVAGCGGESGGPGQKDALIMVVNGCPDAGALAFAFNDTKLGGDNIYGAASAFFGLKSLDASQQGYDVALQDSSGANVFDNQEITFNKDTSTILLAFGLKNYGSETQKALRFVQSTPNRIAPIGNRARLIIFHGFNRKTGFGTPRLTLQTRGDTPIFQSPNVNYGEFSTIEVDSGTYKFIADGNINNSDMIGKDPDNDGIYLTQEVDGLGKPKPVTLDPGTIYLVLMTGLEPSGSAKGTLKFLKVAPQDQ